MIDAGQKVEDRRRQKVREDRLRRWAKRLGLQFRKSRARFWSIDDNGGYRIEDADGDLVAGETFDLDIEAVVQQLADQVREALRRALRQHRGEVAAHG